MCHTKLFVISALVRWSVVEGVEPHLHHFRQHSSENGFILERLHTLDLGFQKQEVLLVIDMQKDYDTQANIDMYGSVLSPYVGNIQSIVEPINRVRDSQQWDKVIFTQDWIGDLPTTPGQHAFCMAGTQGAELLDGLTVDREYDFFFTKNFDDAFNTLDDILWWKASRHKKTRGYGLRNEGIRIGADSNALADIMVTLGFHPSDTRLTIVGQMLDRCVLKAAMHARYLGYDVVVVKDAVYTSSIDQPASNWSIAPPATLDVSSEKSPKWMLEITRERHSAGKTYTFGYLEKAHVGLITSDALSSSARMHWIKRITFYGVLAMLAFLAGFIFRTVRERQSMHSKPDNGKSDSAESW